jgi:hypothetical protein
MRPSTASMLRSQRCAVDDAAPYLPQDEKRQRSRDDHCSYRGMARIVQPEQQRHDGPQQPLISSCNGQSLIWVKSGRPKRVEKSRGRIICHAIPPFGIRGVQSGRTWFCELFRERAVADRSKLAEKDFWNHTPQEIRAVLGCGLEGLGSKAASQRLALDIDETTLSAHLS